MLSDCIHILQFSQPGIHYVHCMVFLPAASFLGISCYINCGQNNYADMTKGLVAAWLPVFKLSFHTFTAHMHRWFPLMNTSTKWADSKILSEPKEWKCLWKWIWLDLDIGLWCQHALNPGLRMLTITLHLLVHMQYIPDGTVSHIKSFIEIMQMFMAYPGIWCAASIFHGLFASIHLLQVTYCQMR